MQYKGIIIAHINTQVKMNLVLAILTCWCPNFSTVFTTLIFEMLFSLTLPCNDPIYNLMLNLKASLPWCLSETLN